MPFKKGQVRAETAGIKKGQKQVRTLEWEEFGRQILETGMPRMLEIMESGDETQFSINFMQLLEYFKPKLSRSEVKQETAVVLNLKSLSDEDLKLLEEL